MKFQVTHKRAFAGNDIKVLVMAEGKEAIRWVEVMLDAESLDEADLPPDSEVYDREFPSAGEAGPETDHLLRVTAMTWDGDSHSSTTQWTDAT